MRRARPLTKAAKKTATMSSRMHCIRRAGTRQLKQVGASGEKRNEPADGDAGGEPAPGGIERIGFLLRLIGALES
jgi:hypothetical protein